MSDDTLAPIKKSTPKERRTATRRPSGSYKAVVTLKPLLGKKKHINVKVLNISSKGARFSSKYNFSDAAKITLSFKVQEGDTWKIPSKIVGIYGGSEYGIFFDTLQTDLIDQLIKFEKDPASG